MNCLCTFIRVCACAAIQVPLQVERSSPGGRELHRGSLHAAASLSSAQGRYMFYYLINCRCDYGIDISSKVCLLHGDALCRMCVIRN